VISRWLVLDRANSIFWTRAKSIPYPQSVVYPAQPTVPPALQAWEMQLGNASTGLHLDGAIVDTTGFQAATNERETCSSNDSTLVELEEELAEPCPSLADENDMGNPSTGQQLDGAISETTDFQIATNHMETGSEYELAPCSSLVDDHDAVGSETSPHRYEIIADSNPINGMPDFLFQRIVIILLWTLTTERTAGLKHTVKLIMGTWQNLLL
jgi:hypothetical protein